MLLEPVGSAASVMEDQNGIVRRIAKVCRGEGRCIRRDMVSWLSTILELLTRFHASGGSACRSLAVHDSGCSEDCRAQRYGTVHMLGNEASMTASISHAEGHASRAHRHGSEMRNKIRHLPSQGQER